MLAYPLTKMARPDSIRVSFRGEGGGVEHLPLSSANHIHVRPYNLCPLLPCVRPQELYPLLQNPERNPEHAAQFSFHPSPSAHTLTCITLVQKHIPDKALTI